MSLLGSGICGGGSDGVGDRAGGGGDGASGGGGGAGAGTGGRSGGGSVAASGEGDNRPAGDGGLGDANDGGGGGGGTDANPAVWPAGEVARCVCEELAVQTRSRVGSSQHTPMSAGRKGETQSMDAVAKRLQEWTVRNGSVSSDSAISGSVASRAN